MNELDALRERAKELGCLYRVQGIIEGGGSPVAVFRAVCRELPSGWQWPDVTGVRVRYLGREFAGPAFAPAHVHASADLQIGHSSVGCLEVSVHAHAPEPILPEEHTLLAAVARRLGSYLEGKQAELLGLSMRSDTLHWTWRQRFAEAIAAALDLDRYGIEAVYLGGSTQSGTAGASSDIDLYLVSSADRSEALLAWLDGWSACLSEVARQHTGVEIDGLLNISWWTEPPTRHSLAAYRLLRQRPG
ncbi:MAG: nucleotidyltransferase domain-containing protein [Myxococcota bacterium]